MTTKKTLIEVQVLPPTGYQPVRLYCEPSQVGPLIEFFSEKDYHVTTSSHSMADQALLRCVNILTLQDVQEKFAEHEILRSQEESTLFDATDHEQRW